ncbi:hypothetical protein [Streptomyces formicae]|uniref:Uncharacterized protein n=1 Tax=Streptomyces formicae TaxID=1616117 RepID=A0ABY3WV83_9ACTN|nr:hypothetical protein [Streptomyces formicae]UNM14712.1 hypothetical protein J4032_27520 [Streptomyces formicae]
MLEEHRNSPPRIIPVGSVSALAPPPIRTPGQARGELDAQHATRMEERPPGLFHVPNAPQTWRHLHHALMREEPET